MINRSLLLILLIDYTVYPPVVVVWVVEYAFSCDSRTVPSNRQISATFPISLILRLHNAFLHLVLCTAIAGWSTVKRISKMGRT